MQCALELYSSEPSQQSADHIQQYAKSTHINASLQMSLLNSSITENKNIIYLYKSWFKGTADIKKYIKISRQFNET